MLRRLAGLAAGPCRPVLLLNGPVGAGKSTLARALRELAPRFGLRLTVASIDDAYLPLEERQRRLAGNPFGVSRVPPGSHDVSLLLNALAAWRSGSPLHLPRFDKTLAGGQGDRAGETVEQADALVLEGWLMGCRPLDEAGLVGRRDELASWGLTTDELDWLPRWNRELEAYQPLWDISDGLWLLRPSDWSLPLRWRFQAEARQRRAGGGWLNPQDLKQLVLSSLHSLPPPLYQQPLEGPLQVESEPGSLQASSGRNRQRGEGLWGERQRGERCGAPTLWGITRLDGRRRCLLGPDDPQASSLSASSAIG